MPLAYSLSHFSHSLRLSLETCHLARHEQVKLHDRESELLGCRHASSCRSSRPLPHHLT